jgi:hypothetical protein
MPRNRVTKFFLSTHHTAEETRENHSRDFWMCETGTGEKVAKLHDYFLMMMMAATMLINNDDDRGDNADQNLMYILVNVNGP